MEYKHFAKNDDDFDHRNLTEYENHPKQKYSAGFFESRNKISGKSLTGGNMQ